MPDRSFILPGIIRSGVFHTSCLSLSLMCGMTALAACDGGIQSVSITAEDFRFTPDLVRVGRSSPFTFHVYNAGREEHEFDSAILVYAAKNASPRSAGPSTGSSGIIVGPGESFRMIVAPPAGTYLYICRRKGHANMTGTLIVEE